MKVYVRLALMFVAV